jgi:sulfide:quinone oxidoreductase
MSDRFRRPDGLPPRVIVVGGGIAAMETVLALRANAGMRVDIELIAPNPELRYPPLQVVEPFGFEPPRVGLAGALDELGAVHHLDAVADVEPERHELRTRDGAVLHYEALVLALGARAVPPPSGMVSFGDPAGRVAFAQLLAAAEKGHVEHLLFAAPPGLRWQLPLYELAVITANRLAAAEPEAAKRARIALVTPEHAPLEVFGGRASGQLLEYIESLGIAFVPGTHVERVARGEAVLAGGRRLRADRVVTVPALRGPEIPGVPHDAEGFIPVDAHGAVHGAEDVYAAGDATASPVKHGGLATQQADAVAEAIAARAGAPIAPSPHRPVLRGMLLTSHRPQYLEADLAGDAPASVRDVPLWWPPLKVAGRYLAPYLAQRLGVRSLAPAPQGDWTEGAIPCELTLPIAS